jgi:tripartite-type tricarboxylate transporter receptor subunit TctC
VARILVPRKTEVLGQRVIVENVRGPGGMVGSNRVTNTILNVTLGVDSTGALMAAKRAACTGQVCPSGWVGISSSCPRTRR